MKTILYEFDPVIYPFPLLVSKKFDSAELNDLFYVVNTDNELEDAPDVFNVNPNLEARTINVVSRKTNLRYYLVMLVRTKIIGTGTISHESEHVSNMIAELLGFLPNKSQYDEPCCYLTGWVANCIESVLRGHTDRMHGKLVETI